MHGAVSFYVRKYRDLTFGPRIHHGRRAVCSFAYPTTRAPMRPSDPVGRLRAPTGRPLGRFRAVSGRPVGRGSVVGLCPIGDAPSRRAYTVPPLWCS